MSMPKVDDVPNELMACDGDVKPVADVEYPRIFSDSDRVKVVEFSPVGTYRFNVANDSCGICRNNLMAPSGTQEETEDNHSTMGECGHAYHTKCINQWLRKTNGQGICPSCRTPWNLSKNTTLDTRTFSAFLKRIQKTN